METIVAKMAEYNKTLDCVSVHLSGHAADA